MAHIRRDRVADTLTGSGDGPLTLADEAPQGYRPPADVMSTNDTGVFTMLGMTSGIFQTVKATYDAGAHTLTPTIWYDGNGTEDELVDWDGIEEISVIMGVPAALAVLMGSAIDWGAAIPVPSATTTAIGAADGNWLSITGNTPILGFDVADEGVQRWMRFAAGIVLTYDEDSMILPGSEDITTRLNDAALFVSLGDGDWECLWYTRRDGRSLNVKHATIASATPTVDLGAVLAQSLVVTGSVGPIESWGSSAPEGDVRYLSFAGSLSITYNPVSMILTESHSMNVSAGDSMIVRHEASGVWRQVGATGRAGSTAVPPGAVVYTANNFGAL